MTFRLRTSVVQIRPVRKDLSVFSGAGHGLLTKTGKLPFRVKHNPDPAPSRSISKDTLPSNPLLAVDLEATTAGYPAGTGSAVIFRSIPVNNRLVR